MSIFLSEVLNDSLVLALQMCKYFYLRCIKLNGLDWSCSRQLGKCIDLNLEQGWIIQCPDCSCRILSLSTAVLVPNNFSASLLSDGWKKETNCCFQLPMLTRSSWPGEPAARPLTVAVLIFFCAFISVCLIGSLPPANACNVLLTTVTGVSILYCACPGKSTDFRFPLGIPAGQVTVFWCESISPLFRVSVLLIVISGGTIVVEVEQTSKVNNYETFIFLNNDALNYKQQGRVVPNYLSRWISSRLWDDYRCVKIMNTRFTGDFFISGELVTLVQFLSILVLSHRLRSFQPL